MLVGALWSRGGQADQAPQLVEVRRRRNASDGINGPLIFT
jgi:hypothetical protein